MTQNSLFECVVVITYRKEIMFSSCLHFTGDELFVSKQVSENMVVAKEVTNSLSTHPHLFQIFDRREGLLLLRTQNRVRPPRSYVCQRENLVDVCTVEDLKQTLLAHHISAGPDGLYLLLYILQSFLKSTVVLEHRLRCDELLFAHLPS